FHSIAIPPDNKNTQTMGISTVMLKSIIWVSVYWYAFSVRYLCTFFAAAFSRPLCPFSKSFTRFSIAFVADSP
ncbi:hypothetical protein, partial [Butyrivibrio sp. VCB2001]|uniref:hypothetical protein n=1 Tax=Butyrivibrio sp. VCB2001 TaxID=1280667 RepID=UPI001A99673E